MDNSFVEKMRYEHFFNEGKLTLQPRIFGNMETTRLITFDLIDNNERLTNETH